MAKTSRPKYLREAPEWFDLEKYEAVRELDAKGWLYQLARRLLLYCWWKPCEAEADKSARAAAPDSWHQEAEKIWETITEFGVLPLPCDLPDSVTDPCSPIFVEGPFDYSAVRTLTNYDVFQFLSNREDRDFILTMLDTQAASIFNEELADPFYRHVLHQVFKGDHHSSTFVGIDLKVSDEQLVFDFRKWLSSIRVILGYPDQKRNFSSNDFGTWRQFRVLPYLDLQFWAKRVGSKYTNEKMASLLFDITVDVGKDTVRRTVKRHAETFLDAYPSLRAQVEGSLKDS